VCQRPVIVGRFSLLAAGSLVLGFVVSFADAQLTPGAVGGRAAYKPSQQLGVFNTGVVRDNRYVGQSQFGYGGYGSYYKSQGGAMRGSGLGRDTGMGYSGMGFGMGGMGGAPPASPDEVGRAPISGPSASVTTGLRDIRAGSTMSGRYGDLGPRAPSKSVLDILATGGKADRLPGAPKVGDDVLEGRPVIELPKIRDGQGIGLDQWVDEAILTHVMTGQAQLRKKDYAGARNSFSVGKMIDPNSPSPRVGLLQIDLLSGNYNKATQMLRDLGRRAPQVFATRFDVPLWHESQEAYDEFLREFRQQVASGSGASEMVSALTGYVAWTQGDRAAATNQLRQAARLVPQEQAWVNILKMLESPVLPSIREPSTRAASVK